MKLQRVLIKRGLAAGAVSALALFAASVIRRQNRRVQFFKSLNVSAPPHVVFDFWTRFENFPGSFSHIKDVQRTGRDNEWRWTIAVPSGETLEWDTWVTESIPHKSIAWESAPNAKVKSAGVVQFSESGLHSTRIDIRMSYAPGVLGVSDTLFAAFGRHPQASFEEGVFKLQARFDEDIAVGDQLSV